MKAKSLLFALLMTLFTTTAMMGQEIVTVCDGTDSNEHLPFRAELSKYDFRYQIIYPATDLAQMVEMEIKSMVFYIDPSAANGSLYGFQQGSWTVSLGETNATSISNYDNTTPLTQVFSGQFIFTNRTVTVTFTQPYRYHGGNLLFDINHKKTTVDGVKLYFLGTEMGYRSAYGSSLPMVCSNFLPKTTFTAEIPVPCETPQNLSFQVSDPFNYTTQVSWTGGSGTFEMQYRKATKTTWTELGQTNNNQYTLENLEPDREYLFRVRSICNGEHGYWLNGSFSTPASGFLIPYSYDFESPEPYEHWISSTYTVLDDNATYSHSGTHYLKFNNTVQLPTFAASTNTLRLEFWACPEYNYNEAGNLVVGYLTDPSDANTFVPARTFSYTEWMGNLALKKKHVDFENAPAGARIVFRQMNASTLVVRYWYIDDISVTTRPDCLEPLDLEVNNITEHSAELSWTARNGQTSWTLCYKKSTDSNYTAVNVQTYPFTLTGLDPNTNYEFYVTADCGSTESSEPSELASFKTLCSELDLPYTYDFETDAPFDCWIPFSGVSIQHSASNSHSGTGYLFFNGTSSNLVALPQFAEPFNTLRVVFWVQPEIWNAGTFSIGYMTDLDDANSFVPVETYSSQSAPYNVYDKKVVELTSVPQDAFIAFQQIPTYRDGWYLDDVTVETIPTCKEPMELTATNITASTAELSWTTQNDESSWTVYYKNTAEENYHSVNVNTNPYTLTGLYSSTEYEYYVVAHCSDTEHSDPSDPFTFITECGGTYSVPYRYDFEGPKPWECWNHTSGADMAADGWSNYCHSGRRCIVFNGDGSQFATLPLFQEATNTLRVEFWIQPLTYVQSGNGNFAVGTMTDPNDANTFTTIQSYAYNDWSENVCKRMVIDLDNVPADAYIAFKQYNCSYNYLWFLDDVSVSSIPSCREPQDLTADHFTDHSAQLSWTARNGETAWTVCFKKSTDTNYTEMAVTTNPCTLTGLDAGTEYEYYVISNCDSNNQSDPSTTFTFTTECGVSVPYTCDFEDYSLLSCWHLITGVISDENSYFSHNGEGYLRFERSSGPESNFVALPQLQTPDNNLHLVFWIQPQSNTSSSGKLDVGYLTSLNDTSTFVTQASFAATDWAEASYNNNYERKVIELSGIPENAYIAFRHYNHSNNGGWFVDDVMVTPIPTCPEPTDFVVSDLTDHTATLNWVETGQATSWVVEYGIDPDFMDCISVPVSGTPMLELHDLTTDATYYARVYAKCTDTDHSYYATPLEFVATEKILIFGPYSNYSHFLVPTSTNYNYSLTQQIYTVEELGEAGMIESIDFYMVSGGDITRKLDIYLVSTDQTAFTSADDAIPATENDLVFSGSVNFTNAAWNTITFDRGFLYDGLHNVAIIVNDKTGSHSSPRNFRSSWDWGAIGLARGDQSNPFDPSNPPQLNIYTQEKNHIRVLKYPYGECMRPSLLNVSEVKFDRATLNWVEHGTSQAWMVHYEYTDDNQVPHEAEVEAGENPFTLTGLLPETTYTVKVRPVCNDETTAWCTSVTFTTREECPVSTDLDVSNITFSTADLSWSGDPDVASYTVRYRIGGMLEAPFSEGFEEEAAFLEWQFINLSSTINTDYVGRTTGSRRSGNYGFSFSSHDYSSQYDQYLISPELTETGTLQFYYRCSSYMQEVFRVGYSTSTGDVEAFVWGEEQVAASTSWTAFTMELPTNTKHFAIHYYTECHLQLYVDDITIHAYEVAPGEWQTAVFEETNGVITGLDGGTPYEAQVKSTCSEEEWSNLVAFTTVPSEYTFEGSGTEEDPYLIASAEDWRHLSENLKNNYDYAGKHFLQTNDFSVVSVMLGLGTRFEGVYDGGGHTLTFHAGTAEMPQTKSYCALFSKVGTATIKNLNIDGAIYSSSNNIGGLVGDVDGDLFITNCRNTMIISDTRNYSSNSVVCHGGFVSYVQSGTTTITGCVFHGDLLGEYVIYCNGFIGYINTANNASAIIADCFLDPVNVTWPFGCYGTIHNFARAGNYDHMTLTNDYYAKTLECEPQGQKVYKVTIDDPEHVSLNYSEVTTSYDNSQLSIINNGLICEGVLYGLNNKTYQLQIENIPQGFAVQLYANGVQLPISNSQCSLTINGEDVVITTEITGVGEPIYEINSTDDWNLMAYMVQLGFVDYTNQPLNLNSDITVSTTVGTSVYPFRGTFEGNGHTITFDMGTSEMPSSEQYCAPFRYVGDADIQNLNIEGTVYTSAKFAGGLAGIVDGNLTVFNCRSALTINSKVNGDGSHGGFVGYIQSGSASFYGCVSGGQLQGGSTTNCGGFVGWTAGNVSLTFTNCLFAPASITWNSNGSQTFARAADTSPFTYVNSGYHKAFGGGQGIKFQSIRPEHPSMIFIAGFGGETTTYLCSGLSVINNGIIYDGVCYGAQNNTFQIQLQACEGYAISEVTANGQPVQEDALGYLIPVATADVLIDASMTLVGDPVHEINSTGDWNLFAIAVASGNHNYENETVTLNADISITEMVGKDSNKAFKGTFEGNGHTITMNLNSDADWCAPFAYTYGATIRNLAIEGTINTSGRYAGGVVGRNGTGTLTMTNVISSVTINSTYEGNAFHGGLVGYAINATFEGCVFNGSLLGESSTGCGGLLGYKTYEQDQTRKATFTNCLFVPTNVTVSSTSSYTIANNSTGGVVEITNCYYLQTLGTAQGQQVFRIIPDEGVTMSNSGSVANDYDVSGLTCYNAGIQFNEELYACNGETVSLYLESTPTQGCITDSYIVDAGSLSGSIHYYTLVMPNQDVLVSLAPDAWEGDGTEESPYLIYTFNQWKILSNHINNATMTYSGEHFKLMNDITITENFSSGTPSAMVGISENVCFQGYFDGNEHTITLNIKDTSNESYCAPFRIVKNATIKRLHVTGVIEKTQKKHVGGIVGQSFGNTYLVACRSSVNIISGTDGDGSHGGLVGDVRGGTINLYTCLFDGEFNGPKTTKWGGFIGYLADNKDANFVNCLFDPKAINIKDDGNRTFVRSGSGCDISYTRTFYTQTCGNAQAENYADFETPLGVEWHYNGGRLVPDTELYTFVGEGTEASPYLVDEWHKFVVNVNMGENYSGKYLQMKTDWHSYSRDGYAMAGLNEEYSFQGTFDGNGHKFDYHNWDTYDSDEYCGPFRVIKNATIKRTYFTGTVYKRKKKHGGIIGQAYGTNHIVSCRSGIAIHSQIVGDGSHGGFLGVIRDGSTYFIDCRFDGNLEGNGTTKWGGFVGWVKDGKDAYFINCLFDPVVINVYDRDDSREFARYDDSDDVHITNSYRNNYLNKSQGIVVPDNWSAEQLRDALGVAWEIITENNSNKVVPIMAPRTLEGSGTLESPYLIASTDDWNTLALHVRLGNSYAGKYVQLADDITINTMVGTEVQDVVYHFGGIFDGNGHTLNLDFNGSADYCAPFAFIDNATIQNLHLTGSIATEGMRPASIAGFVAGNSTITNCWSEVAISSSYGSDIDAGAFAARVNADQTLTLNGCRFTGSITYSHTSGYEGGGMVGWTQDNATAVLNDCLFEPSSISMSIYSGSYMFVSGKTRGILNNCFINEVAAASQLITEGKVPHSITAEEGITVTNAGTATEYDVSDITSYGTGILLDNILYAGNGDEVSLNFEREEEPGFSTTYNASTGTLSGTENPYTLTMPDEDVFITAETVVSDWEGSGTEEDPYIIYTWQQLDLLSVRVNGPQGQSSNTFANKFFLIANDIEYPYYSEWDNLESEEDNFEAIGTGNMVCFQGTLDGDGHTISGLRINNLSSYQGLFGYLSGTVKNLTIDNTRIMGRDFDGCGAIAGYNENGTVINCHVTSTVALHLIKQSYSVYSYCGGIVGQNYNSSAAISGCTSEANITAHAELSREHNLGGIVGWNNQGVVLDNLAVNATIIPSSSGYAGAIAGKTNGGTIERNYYANCTVNGVENATGVGSNNGDIILNDGAVPCPTRTLAGYGNSDGGYVLLASPIGTVRPEIVSQMLDNEFDLYRFNQAANNEWENYEQEGDHYHFDLEAGRGYLYANSGDVTLAFPGTPYTGSGEIALSKTTGVRFEGWNLVGNPYYDTAYIEDSRDFYTMKADGSEIIAADVNSIKPMEGIFVIAENDEETMTFTTTEPEHNDKAMLTLNLTQGRGIIDRAIIRFGEGQQLPKFQIHDYSTKISIQQGDKDYAVVNMGGDACVSTTEIPVNFKAKENGVYTLTVSTPLTSNLSTLTLLDLLTGDEIDLLGRSSYTFNASTDDDEARFTLVLRTQAPDSEYTQECSVNEGWNWWSTYIEMTGVNGIQLLENSLGDNGLQIKSQRAFASNSEFGWYGNLNTLNNESMYLIRTNQADDIAINGVIANPADHVINLTPGWNWIGYVENSALEINEALANLSPADGDVIKSQTDFAIYYNGYGWWGDLQTMQPGQGYMILSDSDASFTYPVNARGSVDNNQTNVEKFWNPVIGKFPTNMSVMAVIELDGDELRSEEVELAAFDNNGECRGSALLRYVKPIDRYVAFLTVEGNTDEAIHFMVRNEDQSYTVNENLTMNVNEVVGTAHNPFRMTLNGTGINENNIVVGIMPNLTTRGQQVRIELPVDLENATIEIVDVMGRVIYREMVGGGDGACTVSTPDVIGVYTIRITDGQGKTGYGKLVVR